MKKILKGLIVTMVLVMTLSMVPSVNTQAATKKAKTKVTYTLKKGTLTIKGKGEMPKSMIFKNNKKIKKVVIKKGVTSISNYAFSNCKNLKEVKIANTVKEIGWHSFEGTKIKKITIPSSVKKIGNGVFSNCNKLKTITMPGDFKQKMNKLDDEMYSIMSGKKIETINFNSNFNLDISEFLQGTNWNVSKKDPNYKSINGVIYSKDGKEIVRVPSGRTELVIATGCETFCLQSILYSEYYYDEGNYICCDKLKKITIPETVKSIEDKKYKCDIKATEFIPITDIVIKTKKLDAQSIVTLVKNLKELGYFDKDGIINMEKLMQQLPGRITVNGSFYILDGNILLNYYGKDNTVVVPSEIKSIADSAFSGIGMKKVVLPEGLEKIGDSAFYGADLIEINLPSSLNTIESNAFEATMLKKIEIPRGIKKWGSYVFRYSALEEVVLPDEMIYIPKGMFYECSELEKINVPKKLTSVNNYAFYRTGVDVQKFLQNENLTTIYKGAFGFTNWTKLTIPKHIKKIGKYGITSIRDEKKKLTVEGTTKNYHQDAFCENNEQKTLTVNFKEGIKQAYTDIQIMSFGDTKGNKAKKVEFQWFKISDVDGYDIRVCSDKKYKKVIKKVTAKKSKKSKTIKINKKYKKVYVKIRPYKVVNGKKVYGKWSKDKM